MNVYIIDGKTITTKDVVVTEGQTMEVNTDHLNFDGSFKDPQLQEALKKFNEKCKQVEVK